MKNFIQLTTTEDTNSREIWVSKYNIKYMESDKQHNQTYIYILDKEEIKVVEKIEEILEKFNSEI